MSNLLNRVERLEEQKDEAERGAVQVLYRPDGSCRVGDQEYASEEEAKAAHPTEVYYFLPEKGSAPSTTVSPHSARTGHQRGNPEGVSI